MAKALDSKIFIGNIELQRSYYVYLGKVWMYSCWLNSTSTILGGVLVV